MSKSIFNSITYTLFCGAAVFLLGGCAVNSNIYLDPQQEFVLGEADARSFRLDMKNVGGEEVEVKAIETKTGEETQSLVLHPKQEATVIVSGSETALLRNASDKRTRVTVRLSKGVIGMRFQGLEEKGK